MSGLIGKSYGLDSKPSLRDEEIGVAVKDEVVTLTGAVSNYVAKYDAKHIAETIME
jgi:osmotically-inducible protein OsmY